MKKSWKKGISFVSGLLLVVQSLTPGFFAAAQVYAQDATPTPTEQAAPTVEPTTTPTETATTTPEPTINPTLTETPTPSPAEAQAKEGTPEVSPEITPEATPSPTPTEELTPSPTIPEVSPSSTSNEPPHETSPPKEDGQILDGASTIAPTPTEEPTTPTPTITVPETSEGHISATILNDVKASSLDLDASNIQSSGTLTTDKADYAPTDTAVITGTGFLKNHTYSLTISSDDAPATSTTVDVTTDENGNFVYAYQLDGTYRPNYKVEIKQGEHIIATTTFTDGPESVNLDQCRNGSASSPNDCLDLGGGGQGWANGNAGSSQAHYVEGYSIPYRAVMENLPIGSTITLNLGYNIKHGGKHAIDYLTHYNRLLPHTPFAHPAETINPTDGVSGISGTTTTFAIPAPDSTGSPVVGQPTTSFNNLPAGERVMTLFGGTISNISYVSQGDLTAASSESVISITFTVDSATAVFAWGGHIASRLDWGFIGSEPRSAGGINGSPYHMDIKGWSLGHLGSQDRSLSADAVISPSNITVHKVTSPNGGTGFGFTTTGSITPATFSLDDGGTQMFNAAPGTYTVSENDPSPAYFLSNLVCTASGAGTSATPNIGTRTASITIGAGGAGAVDCTFTNSFNLGSLQGRKYNDTNLNGVMDQSDPFLDGWTINLYNSNWVNVGSQTTGNTGTQGQYKFDALSPGTYYVCEALQTGWQQTGPVLGAHPVDYNGAVVNSSTAVTNQSPNAQNEGGICWQTAVNGDNLTWLGLGNVQTGTIIVEKQTSPDAAAGSFTFTGTAAGTISDNGQITKGNLLPGTYTSIETDPSPLFDLTNITCDDPNSATPSTTDLSSRTATFNVDPGETIKCTFTNTRKQGRVTIQKLVEGSQEPASSWSFTIDGVQGTFHTGDTVTLDTGTYTITESGPTNYTASVAGACSNLNGSSATLTVSDQAGTCTFTNTRNTGHLIVQKVVDDQSNLNQWQFKLDNGTFVYADDQGVVDFGQVTTGVNHTITEQGIAGYYLDTVTGTNCSARQNGNATTATVTNGGTTTCQFNNKKIPKYEGPISCPNEAPIKKLLGTYSVGSQDADGVTVPVVTAGNSYLFEATGTFRPTSPAGWYADAGYTTNNNWTSLASQYGINGVPPDYGAHALLANLGLGVGIVNWGTYANSHIYSSYLPSTISNPQFVIGDRWSTWYGTPYDNQVGMRDNQGKLTLNVYACEQSGSISGTKFEDQNGNHVKDPGEPGLSGWSIELDKDANDSVDATVVTDGTGAYIFQNLSSATYRVREIGQPGWAQTTPNPSDIALTPGQNVTDVDFGNQMRGTITIIKDANPNNAQNFEFTSPQFTTFQLDDDNSGPLSNTKVFSDLGSNTYTITEGSVAGWKLTSLVCNDTDAQINIDGRSATVTLNQPGEAITCTFTNTKLGSISGRKFNDLNGNHVRNTGEPYLSGWTIYLDTNDNGQLDGGEASRVTNASGNYSFTNLIAGTYRVREVLTSGWQQTRPNAQFGGTGRQADGSYLLTIGAGTTYTNRDFGNFQLGTISGHKWYDVNGDGIWQDETEDPLEGWTIRLGNASTTTDSEGYYEFTNLSAGSYALSEDLQPGWAQTKAPNSPVVVTSGLNLTDQDFGNWGNLSITACKYEDSNGLAEGGETSAVSGWGMTLGNNTQPTERTGCYTFDHLTPDQYTVMEESRTGWFSADQTQGSQTVTLTNESATVNFYNFRKGTITGDKWEDANADGKLTCEEGEESSICENKLKDWTIFLDTNGNGVLDNEEISTKTDENGAYSFEVDPGTYRICEVVENGWEQTYPVNRLNNCHEITISSGGQSSNNDFGNHLLVPILTIAKTNNTGGADRAPGDSVVFTLTITATQSAVNTVTVIDLPAAGFKYRTGSWTATSNGNPGLIVGEPNYTSPGTWNLGNMAKDEVITLTYIADIDSSELPGLYKDLAWTQGKSLAGATVLGNTDTGIFVGTNVNVVKEQQPGSSINIIHTEQGSVLGASTELPATGANSLWIVLAVTLLSSGISLIVIGRKLRRHYA